MFTSTLALLSIAATASAAALDARQSFSVPLLYPGGVTWFAGQQHNVTWDPSSIPTTSSFVGQLQLTKSGAMAASPSLVGPANFSMSAGRVQIAVPNVQSGSDYAWLLTVIPTSGSGAFTTLGPQFTIDNTSPTTSTFVTASPVTTGSLSSLSSLSASTTASPSSATGASSISTSLSTALSTITGNVTATIVTTDSAGSSTTEVTTIVPSTASSGSSSGSASTTSTETVTSGASSSTATSPSSSGSGSSGSGTSSSSSSTSTSSKSAASAVRFGSVGAQAGSVAVAVVFALVGSALVL